MSDDPRLWSSDEENDRPVRSDGLVDGFEADIPEAVPYPRAAIAALVFAVVAVVAVVAFVLYAAFVADRSGPAVTGLLLA